MIYDVYWAGLYIGHQITVNQWNKVYYPNKETGDIIDNGGPAAEFIKSSENDTFVFVLSNRGAGQWKPFDEWVKKYDLAKYIKVDAPNISNPSHPEAPRTIRLVIMQSENHFQHKELEEKELQTC